ncbi:hypothetical protein CFC21_011233, partial [Triticum aestivum]|jgi:hypothetical protein
MRAP